MPVRSLDSSVMRWPDRARIHEPVSAWVARQRSRHGRIVAAGYFGSYARGDAGVGSDVDLVLVVTGWPGPFERRGLAYDTTSLPVPAELVVYTVPEFAERGQTGFLATVADEAVWVTAPPPEASG